MKDSIVIDMKYADYDMIDGSYGVERHHLMGGANRSHADEDGLWVPLSPDHHNSSRMSVHHNKETQASQFTYRRFGESVINLITN